MILLVLSNGKKTKRGAACSYCWNKLGAVLVRTLLQMWYTIILENLKIASYRHLKTVLYARYPRTSPPRTFVRY